MNWRKSRIFKSFCVKGCLLEAIYQSPQKYMVCYDSQEIKIYKIVGITDITIQLIDKIQLFNRIQKIVFIESLNLKYLLIQNDIGQISALNPNYPYEHKLIHIPDNFTQFTMSLTQNNSLVLLQNQSEICIIELNHRGEFISQIIDMKKFGCGQLVQAESTQDGTLYFLSHSYLMHDELNEVIRQGFNINIGLIKSQIHFCKSRKSPFQCYTFNIAALQILPLERDQMLILSNKTLHTTKSGKADLGMQFQQELPNNSFMRHIPQTQQVLVCHQQMIEIINLYYDHFGFINNFSSYQQLSQYPGIMDITVSTFNEQLTLLYLLTDCGVSHLSCIHTNQAIEIEPPLFKKIRMEENEPFKLITQFQGYNNIFNFAVMGNQLCILSGNQQQQLLCKIQHEIHPLINQQSYYLNENLKKIANPLFFDSHLAYIEKEQLHFYRINRDLSLVDKLAYVLDETILSNGSISTNTFYIQYQTQIQIIQTNPISSYIIPLVSMNVKQQLNYFIGVTPDNNVEEVIVYELDLNNKSLLAVNISKYLKIVIEQYDLIVYQKKLVVMIINKDQLILLQIDDFNSQQPKIVFQTCEFNNNINALINGAQLNSQLYISHTCPSINLQSKFPVQFEYDYIINGCLIGFHDSAQLLIMLIDNQQRITLYQLHIQEEKQFGIFKILFSYQANQIKPFKKYQFIPNNSISQCIIPQLNLTFTEIQGEVLIHFIKQDQEYQDFIIAGQAYLLTEKMDCFQFPALRTNNLPSNNIVTLPIILKDQKIKQIIFIQSFNFNHSDYLLVASKISYNRQQRQFKNEILVYRADNLNDIYAEYNEIDNEEIIKIVYMQTYDLILVMSLLYPAFNTLETTTKIHILKIDSYQKIQEQEYKIIKESVPIDIAVLLPYSCVLVLTQDQIKFFDPPPKTRSSSVMALSLQAQEAQRVPVISYEAMVTVDRWLAVLNGGFKVVVCKLAEEITQPKSEWVIEFGVGSNEKILDIQIMQSEDKLLLTVLDAMQNMHLYSLSKEKNKLKKLGDFQINNISKISAISDKLLLANEGQMYLIDQVEDDQKMNQFDSIIDDLPYICGFHPGNFYYSRSKTQQKGRVWDSYMLDVFSCLSKPLKKCIELRSRVEQRIQPPNYD